MASGAQDSGVKNKGRKVKAPGKFRLLENPSEKEIRQERLKRFLELGSVQNEEGDEVVGEDRKWDFRGSKEQIDKIESALNRAKTPEQITRVALSLREQDRVITELLNNIDPKVESEKSLLTLRRRVRSLMRKARF